MRVSIAGRETEPVHLTYCLNVYPGITWPEVQANIERHVLKHKQRFAPDRPFGVGLRLAGEASSEILRGDELARFREYLDAHGLYVFTMNGFPYGPFHGQAVKAEVHAPDWRDDERVAYTLRLIQTLADLLPDGMDGGISTNPFGYHPSIDTTDRAVWQLFV
ncbi:MAG: metabolite traffic protein EboE, partial [Thermomicrobiales bacterium]